MGISLGALVLAGMSFVVLNQEKGAVPQPAGVGAYAQVPPNRYNTLAQELSARERQLDERERALAAREEKARTAFAERRDQSQLVLITLISLLLLSLILLNFLWDILRARSTPHRDA